MKRAVCIWLPHWPLQRLAVARAELSECAVLLYERRPPHGPRVVSYCPHLATAAAALWGNDPRHTAIRPGMPVAEAVMLTGGSRPEAGGSLPSPLAGEDGEGHRREALVDESGEGWPGQSTHHRLNSHQPTRTPSPHPSPARGEGEDMPAKRGHGTGPLLSDLQPTAYSLQPVLSDPAADRAALEALALWCQRFSPTVGLEEGERPESLLLDASGLDAVFGSEEALAGQVVDAFRQCGLVARVAIADTPAAAWAVARYAPLEAGGSMPAKRGHGTQLSDLRPTAYSLQPALSVPLIVPTGQTLAAIGALSVEALRLPEEICQTLAELGLRRIEQLVELERSTLLARFGAELLAKLDRASGAAAEAIVGRAPPGEMQFERLLEYATPRREMIELVLGELIARACDGLARACRGLLRFECRFELEDRSSVAFVVGLYQPSASPRHAEELARLKLERVRFRQSVTAIRLSVLAADRLALRQQEMFASEDSARRDAPRHLAALVDRLSNRLGSRAVLRPEPVASALPEFAFRDRPLASLKPTEKRPRSNKRSGRAAAGKPKGGKREPPRGDRPIYLEPRPLPLVVVSVAPEGPPMQFRLAGREHRTSRAWGPERVETQWWRSRCVRRDYYQVETLDGQRFWLFRQLNTGKWFLHGEFG